MARTNDKLRDKLVPGGSTPAEPPAAVVSAVTGEITEGERGKYRLPGKAGLVREHDTGTETFEKPAGGQSLALVTDEKLLFVLASEKTSTVRTISYTNVRSVDAKDGLLRSKLTVRAWGEGEYRFKIADSTDLGAAVSYIERAAECWQRVISYVEDATERTGVMGERLEDGDLDGAQQQRETARNKLERAKTQLVHADIEPPQTLVDRVDSAAMEHIRTEIRNRLTRAETLITQAKYQTDAREYTGAYRSYTTAGSHLERARDLARGAELPEPGAIETKLETIDTRLRHLEVRPMALAKQARERADGTDKLDVEVEALQEAFEHYRDTLTAGWGTDLAFEGDTWDIKLKIELTVSKLIEKRQELAARYERRGDDLSETDPDGAIEQYESALDQLEQAQQFAVEFRTGDPGELDGPLDRIAAKRLDCR